jgi:putative SOS response-associated peptidase YedK
MCGRFTLTVDIADLQDAFPGVALPDELPPRYNIAPTQPVAVIANNGENMLEYYRWGLIPAWAKDPKIGNRMINARAETLAEKPAFRTAFKKRRCLIPTDGFYEWRADTQPGRKTKTPMYIRLKSGKPFAFAGLWEAWRPEGAAPILTCTIITTTPNSLVEKIHDRMPVILPPEAYAQWLAQDDQAPDRLSKLLKPYPASAMTAYPVATLVNRPGVDSPELIQPA